MEKWTLTQGSEQQRLITIPDGTGTPIAFQGTETLSGQVWAGDGQAVLFSLAPTWSNPSAGQALVPILSADTSTLAPGIYRVLIRVTDGTGAHDAFAAELVITYAPGSEAVRKTYIGLRDLKNVCSWIENEFDPDQDQAGFADQCADSRDWLDECCLRNYTGGFVSLMGMHDMALNSWFGGGARKTLAGNIWLKQQLDANNLIVSPRIKKVCALYACSIIFQRNLTKGKDYIAYASGFRHQAYQLLVSTTAEIDVTGAGTTPNIPITFTATNSLYA